MAQNSQWDNISFQNLAFPYVTNAAGLNDDPHLVSGSVNTAVTFGGTLIKRYGVAGVPNTSNNLPAGARIDRCWVYETMDTPVPNVYLVASVNVPTNSGFPFLFGSTRSVWKLYYCLISSNVYWNLVSEYRDCNKSTRAHEATVSRGFLLIKSYPPSNGDKLGSIIFDGTGGTVVIKPWGALGPTTPAHLHGELNFTLASGTGVTDTTMTLVSAVGLGTTPFNLQIDYEIVTVTAVNLFTGVIGVIRGAQGTTAVSHTTSAVIIYYAWGGSTHPVTVNIGWKYSYAYQSITGNVTNRVDVETNPDNMASFTGPFLNLCPEVTLQGLADTTNFPKIIVLRTMDGGGSFYVLETVTNPGAGSFTYIDNSLVSAAGRNDPLPDTSLNTEVIGPTLTSNSPPITVISPGVVGVNAVQPSTPIANYSGRLWYGIGNILFYSGDEEITIGVPEECWPTGITGNFFRYQTPVLNVQATTNALYVMCSDTVHVITGSTKDTFNSSPVIQSIGAPYNHPRAVTRYGENVVFLSNDYRIISAAGSSYLSLSDELGTDLQNAINAGGTVDIKFWADLDKEYIIVSAVNKSNPANTQTWIYDIKRSIGGAPGSKHPNFWFSPWNIPATCIAAGRLQNGVNKQSLIFAEMVGTVAFLGTYDVTGATISDTNPAGATINTFDVIVRTNLFKNPGGNHINAIRLPSVTTTLQFIKLDRTKYTADTDPDVTWFADDFWTTPKSLPAPTNPTFRIQSLGYVTLQYASGTVCDRMALQVQKLAANEKFELQNITFIFDPTSVG